MRDRVRFDQLLQASGGYSSGSEAWEALATCAAYIKTINGPGDGEQVIADALRGINLIEIHVRKSTALQNLSSNDRVLNLRSGETYNVTKVTDPDFRGNILVIEAERNRPHG
jgi:head-tail adaptor